ncbi:5'-nucleotidase, lipoprotein e(P4) family [Marilutibacter chinensis]|uniref:5'-nucleotidase, lipoprotein e(P4) family n=1 Tax=Marilutibacter chinensis TaxID=2912247 RepID=A0ABS9HS48_9GAMM|nr:5'-nucleotidase, lipoprotein e(P4) family [Lysobacter chinensis]MCF7221769.1 5'-nucleotidase, lipoprotein e(P4) family [Lysobacter chinensis]MCF7223705.1 5'-nucleotidase, lipoprotein e(P4) family [Lysobacter chinensis]
MRYRSLAACLIVSSLVLAGCQRAEPPAAASAPASGTSATPAAADVPADDNLNAVLWVQTSSEYRALTFQTYRAAADHLDVALAEANWDALVPDERAATAGLDGSLKPAVIMDVDETVLDNSPYQARLIRDGEGYDEVSWAAWVAEKKATAVPGVVDFAKAAAAKGVTILYLSNRAEHLQEATLANLRAVGMPVADDEVFLGLGTFVEGCEQNGSEKACRRQLAGRRYRVLMQFGDQLGDFVEVVDNTAAGRDALMEEYGDWFGERWWMLPNPTYGSWEPAAFNNDWSQPIEVRRAGKRAALDMAP